MSIIRGPRPDAKFYTVSKDISEDRRLSWAARGLLIFLLGKPDYWQVSVKHLIAQTENCLGVSAGRDAVRSLLTELQAGGYVQAGVAHSTDGRFAGMEYVVSEVATLPTPTPQTDYPAPAKPAPANPHLVNTKKKTKTEREAKNQLPTTRKRGSGAAGGESVHAATTPNRRAQLPVDFAVSEAHHAYALQHGLDLPHELATFTAHHTAAGSLMLRWDSAFTTWLLKAKKFAGARGRGMGTPKTAPAPRQGAVNGKLTDSSGQPKDYLQGIDDDGYVQ